MHACQKDIDRLFDALDRATREHEGLSAGFDRELKAIEAETAVTEVLRGIKTPYSER
jgi:aspartyl-tRNA synthetase